MSAPARTRAARASAAEARWRAVIEGHAASGLPVARYCRERGVPASSFFAWRRRLTTPSPAVAPAAFVEVRARGDEGEDGAGRGGGAPVEVVLAGGRRRLLVRAGFCRRTVLDLVRLLELDGAGGGAGATAPPEGDTR